MNNKTFLQKIENLPVPILPTMVGALTLSTIYSNMGYTWVRHITSWIAVIVLLSYIIKMMVYPKTCLKEYSNTVPASLYAGFTMITMILGSYFYNASPVFGKTLWFTGLILHAIHILIFTYRNVVKGVNMQTFVPSWFVTYNGNYGFNRCWRSNERACNMQDSCVLWYCCIYNYNTIYAL